MSVLTYEVTEMLEMTIGPKRRQRRGLMGWPGREGREQ
jgi:hypothetical protein